MLKKIQKVEEWRHQSDDLQSELDAVQREARMQAIEAHRLATTQDSLQEQVEGLRRENKQLSQEVHDLQVVFHFNDVVDLIEFQN